jgi:hypothetical protein
MKKGKAQAGKGDKPRPYDAKRYGKNMDAIKWNSEKRRKTKEGQ